MRVQYTTWVHPFTSAGVVCINVVEELAKLGVDVSIHPLNPENDPVIPNLYSKEVQDALSKGFRDDVINIFFSYPDSYPHVKCRVNVGYTGADTSRWYQTNNQHRPEFFCNQFTDYMLTPSDYSRQIMYYCSVQKDIYLYPHGINFNIFKSIKRERSLPFTFVYAGELTKRKGAQDVIKAFIDVFGIDNQNVQLLLRANTHMMYLESDEIRDLASKSKNIHIHWKNEGQEDFVSYLHAGHVFMYPSRADWYGLPPMEAIATGMPTIATSTNGYYEFIKDMIIPVITKPCEIGDQHPYFKGNWNEPDQYDLRDAMRNVINEYEKHSNKAYEDSFKLKEDFTWKAVTEKYLLPFLEEVDKKHFPKPIRSAKICFDGIKLYEKISK